MMSKVKNIFFVGARVGNEIKNVKFQRCPREVCYCNFLIGRPEKTKITTGLLINANNCKKEFYQMQSLAKRYKNLSDKKRFGSSQKN